MIVVLLSLLVELLTVGTGVSLALLLTFGKLFPKEGSLVLPQVGLPCFANIYERFAFF